MSFITMFRQPATSSLLDEQMPFITSPVLKKDQDEDFNKPDTSERARHNL